MQSTDALRQRMQDLGDDLRRVITNARTRSGRTRGSHVNVARRTNVQTAVNVGEKGAVRAASARQHAPIEQRGE